MYRSLSPLPSPCVLLYFVNISICPVASLFTSIICKYISISINLGLLCCRNNHINYEPYSSPLLSSYLLLWCLNIPIYHIPYFISYIITLRFIKICLYTYNYVASIDAAAMGFVTSVIPGTQHPHIQFRVVLCFSGWEIHWWGEQARWILRPTWHSTWPSKPGRKAGKDWTSRAFRSGIYLLFRVYTCVGFTGTTGQRYRNHRMDHHDEIFIQP
jgi:hypothetical protein